MAPDVAKKGGAKVCKKYTYTEHSKYSQWEKDRRARFNDKLEELSRAMPGHDKENPWKKIEIVEQAIGQVTARKLEATRAHEETVCSLAREVQQLKTVIARFTDIRKVAEDVFKLTSRDISKVLEELQERDKENEKPADPPPVEDPDTEESLAFVAKIARSNDHDYTRTTEETPTLEVEGEVVVETAVPEEQEVVHCATAPMPSAPILVDLVADFETQPLPSYISFDPSTVPALSLPEAPQFVNLQELLWPRSGKASVPNVMTVFVNKGSRSSLLPSEAITTTSNKLPIPRLKQPKRKPRPKKARSPKKKVMVVEEKPTAGEKVAEQEELNDVLPAEAIKESQVDDMDGTLEGLDTVTDTLPIVEKDVIDLQNNEEMEILEETIKEQGERETREKCEKDAKKKQGKRGHSGEKAGETIVVTKKKVDQGKKKSKSSYSIAALCQISVNIGDRPEMANSPGVLSLNSVGTMSPSHTPAPTPTPDPTKGFAMESCGIAIDREENVLEELRTIRPEDVTFETPGGPSVGEAELKKNVSPSQSFLTHFPAVSKGEQEDTISVSTKTIQRDIYQVLKDLDKDLNLESEGLTGTDQPSVAAKASESKKSPQVSPKNPKTATTISVSTATVSRYLPSCTVPGPLPPTSSAALSVYDFSASKPDTPPIPLQKARKHEVRREEARTAVAYKSPEKKTYTEMQSKPKKSPVDAGKTKEGQLGGAQQGQQYPQAMEYQQAQGKAQYQAGSYQARHHGYMAPHYPPYQAMGPLQQQHYHQAHPYPGPTTGPEVDMKTAGQAAHHSRYSCSSHAYLPAPNYHHYPSSGPKHYPGQGQPAWGPHQQHYPKARERGAAGHMEAMDALTSPGAQGSGTFTVNQLVSSSQRKGGGAKRAASGAKVGGPAKAARAEAGKEKEKEDCRKRSGGSRRNKSGGRSISYSAESLMLPSSAGLVVTADTKEEAGKLKLQLPSPAKKEGKVEIMTVPSSSRSQAANSWPANTDHFGGLQLSSLSPSPASLFPPDLSSLDFPMPIFGPEGKDYPPPASQPGQKTPGKQQSACQRAAAVSDWSLNASLLDTGWPLPTLTPPVDPMADPMASYNFMSPMPPTHGGFYSCSAPQAGSRQGQHSYSAHSAANIPLSGYTSSTMVMAGAKAGSSQTFPSSQAQTGSLVNFNLSTIFPEINIPAVGNSASNCQVKPSLPTLPHPGSALEFFPNSHRPGQLGTPELLPHHTLASLHLHPSSSFSTSQMPLPPGLPQHMVPGLTFPNIPDQ